MRKDQTRHTNGHDTSYSPQRSSSRDFDRETSRESNRESSRRTSSSPSREYSGSSRDYDRDFDRDVSDGYYGSNGFEYSVGAPVADRRDNVYVSREHVGKGPKGYQRSDSRILEDVQEELARDGSIDASEIDVSIASGEVTLTGTVSSKQQKRDAEDCAESVFGVTEVNNQLRVNKAGSSSKSFSSSGSSSPAGTPLS